MTTYCNSALFALGILACAARPADACVPAFDRAIVGAPQFEPAGAVTITNETVDVECTEDYACTVSSTFDITVVRPARVTVKSYHATAMTLTAGAEPVVAKPPDSFEAASVTSEVAMATTRIALHARLDVVPFVDGCFTDGVIARHPYLSSARTSNEHVLQIDTTVKPHLKAPSSWYLYVDRREASEHDDATLRLWFTVPGRRFIHGGPLLLVGASSGDGRTFRLRGGWEAAIAKPWLVFGLTGETDFADAWNIALTAEPTTKAWVLPLSLGGGAGAVLANDKRVGGRAQVSIALWGVRMMLSVDVLRGDGVDASVTALVGGSL